MAAGKSTWKRNKLLTARRNYFSDGGLTINTDATQYLNNIPTTLQPLPGTLQPITMPTQAPGIDATQALKNGALQGLQPLPTPSKRETSSDAVKNTNSDWALGGIAGGIGALADMTTNMVNNISASDVKAKKKELLTQTANSQMKGQSANDNFDSLANDMATTAELKKVDKYDLGAKKAGAIATEGLTEGLKGSMAGFGAGSAIQGMVGGSKAYGGHIMTMDYRDKNKYMGGGPIGAIVGGVLGTGMSLVGNLIRNHKAKKAAQEVNEQIEYTNDFNQRSMMNRAGNLSASQLTDLEATYAAFGGPLGIGSPIIDYDFMDRYIRTKELTSQGQDDSSVATNMFAGGGGIHIKPSKRGTFTAAATKHGMGVQEFANRVLANKEDYSPAMVKKANFAKNAAKWNAFGGELNTQGLDFTNGLLQINEGGSHEANPYEGVLMGIDQEGTPNLVEEGETIYNDYVFSNRLIVPKAVRSKYKLRSTKPLTFAEASKKLAKESEERPNDPISQRGLEAMLNDLAIAQEEKRVRQNSKNGTKFAHGGKMGGLLLDGTGYVSNYKRTNPQGAYDRGQVWGDLMGTQMVNRMKALASMSDGPEKREAIKNFYTTANNLQDSYHSDIYNSGVEWGGRALTGQGGAHQTSWQNAGYNKYGDTYSQYYTTRGSSTDANNVWVDNIIGDLTLNRNLGDTRYISPEREAEIRALADELGLDWNTREGKDTLLYFDPRMPDIGGPELNTRAEVNAPSTLGGTPSITAPAADDITGGAAGDVDSNSGAPGRYPTWMRYAPIVGSGLQVLSDIIGLTNKPDYSNANMVLEATRGAVTPRIGFKPIGNYLARQPLDREFYINQLNATAGANRRAISQNAGLNRGAAMSAILASDNNAQNQLGLFARQAEEYNRDDRHKVEDFNRSTNMFNSEGFLKADMANQQAAISGRDFNLRGILAAAEMRQAEKNASDAARAMNFSTLFDNLGNLGRENMAWNWRNFGIATGTFNNIGDNELAVLGNYKRAAKGGKIRRRRLT